MYATSNVKKQSEVTLFLSCGGGGAEWHKLAHSGEGAHRETALCVPALSESERMCLGRSAKGTEPKEFLETQ